MNVFLALVLICLAAALFAFLGVTLSRRVVRGACGADHNLVAGTIFGVAGTVYAVFLAFLVIAVWQKHSDAKANLAEEASLLCTLYRASSVMAPDAGGQLRGLIRNYTRAVIVDEWPSQARAGRPAESARKAALDLFRPFAAKGPAARQNDAAIDETSLGLIDQIQSDRDKRILQAEGSLPRIIWLVAIVGGVIVIVMSFLLYPERGWPHFVMCGMLTAMIAMLVFVIFTFDRPFRGLMRLQPGAFTHALQVYDSVDRDHT
jgi:hypothetical protein